MERLDYDPILNYGFSITSSRMNFQTEFRFLLKNFIVSVPFLVLVPNIEVPKEVSRLWQHARGCQSFEKKWKVRVTTVKWCCEQIHPNSSFIVWINIWAGKSTHGIFFHLRSQIPPSFTYALCDVIKFSETAEQMLILAHAMLFPAKISPHMLKTFHSFFGK